jgi:V8-like Glu-specific endopeptidase
MRFSPSLALASILSAAGCMPPATVGEAQAPIIGGTNDTGDPAVVLIIEGNLTGGEVALCTGEVISPHVILTAGHCTTGKGPYNIYLGDNINEIRGATDLLPGTAHTQPMYSMNVIDNYDIGLIVLDNPIDASITPIPFNKSTDPNTLMGQPVRFIGYGSTGSTSPSDTSAGTKRTVSTTLTKVQPRLLDFTDSRHATCEGDSGGPALMSIDGVDTIVGVTSFGGESQTGCIGGGEDTRVDLYVDFIQPYIDMYDPPPPVITTGPPAPGSVGASCKSNNDCTSKICANLPNGYCTATCNPYATVSACPSALQCVPIDESDPTHGFCDKPARAHSGCGVAATSPSSLDLALMIGLALLLASRRRFAQ